MFALPPNDLEMGDLQPLSHAIDVLCEALDGERAALIEGLAELVRKRAEFERFRQEFAERDHFA